mmetsp:Transcript_11585/g.19013  ORF Transcript_11585/g.19013 Transcript_11585/m.19013 type:complete len:422 (-) Transcript_11585:843-2108(-)
MKWRQASVSITTVAAITIILLSTTTTTTTTRTIMDTGSVLLCTCGAACTTTTTTTTTSSSSSMAMDTSISYQLLHGVGDHDPLQPLERPALHRGHQTFSDSARGLFVHPALHPHTLLVRLEPSEMMNKSCHAAILLLQPNRLRVRIPVFLRPHVPHERVFLLPCRICSCSASSSFALRSDESIALKVASSAVTVKRPILHAYPTKIFPAFATTHVVAALVLFYGRFASRASLGICSYPQRICQVRSINPSVFSFFSICIATTAIAFLLSTTLATHGGFCEFYLVGDEFVPRGQLLAGTGDVCFLAALHAEQVAIAAQGRAGENVLRVFVLRRTRHVQGASTVRHGAGLQFRAAVHHRALSLRQESVHERGGLEQHGRPAEVQDLAAFIAHAGHPSQPGVRHLHLDVGGPAVHTVGMARVAL